MKKNLPIAILASLGALTLAAGIAACGEPVTPPSPEEISGTKWTVEAPSGDLSVKLVLDSIGSLRYSVTKGETTVVEPSALGFLLEEDSLYQMLTVKDVKSQKIDVTYENITGRHQTVHAVCNETVVTLRGGSLLLDVAVRAYDDGFAFRYGIRAEDGSEGTVTVSEEYSEFAMPADSVTWQLAYTSNKPNFGNGNFFSYEGAYSRRAAKNLSGRIISMPMLYRAGSSDIYCLITESGLIGSGYYGSYLAEDTENAGLGILRTVPTPAGGTQEDNDVISYPFTSPWRVGAAGSLGDVVESELVEKVYDDADYWKPDDYDTLTPEEQATYDYDWVEPGIVAWDWLRPDGGDSQTDYDMHKRYVDLAAEMGWKYAILDGGWDGGSFKSATFKNFAEFSAYAHEKGVKLIAWCDAIADFKGSRTLLRSRLEDWKRRGIDGIKIDFFDGQTATNPKFYGEDKGTIAWYEAIYQEAARLRMIVNCHGANKPTGERRIYPNVVNREAIYGDEMKKVSGVNIVNSMFTRMLVGPTDFTPAVRPYSKGITMAQEMALSVLYESGTPSMSGIPDEYRDETVNDFYKALRPSAWTDMKFLGGEPDGYFLLAVKMGEDWYAVGANSAAARTVTFDYSFLGEGGYNAVLWTDGATYDTVVKSEKAVNAEATESVDLAENGGFVIRITKN